VDPHDGELAFLGSALRRSVQDLRQAIQGARAPEQVRGAQLCAYLVAALDAIEARTVALEERFNSTTAEPEREAIVRELRHLNAGIRGLHEATPWLESLRTPSLSLGLVYFLEETSGILLKGTADLVMNRDAPYMYSTMGLEKSFALLLSELDSSVPEGPPPVVISYPRLEEERILLHPVFVHELAHEAVDRHALRDLVYGRHPDIDDLNSRFGEAVAAAVEHQQAITGQAPSAEEAAVMLRGALNGWLEELLCDHLALGYLGPSYLLAAAAFLLPVSSTEPSGTHPPSSLRARLLLDFLDDLNWREFLDSRIPTIMEWLQAVTAQSPRGPVPDHVSFVQAAVVELAEPMRRVTTEHLGSATFHPAHYTSVAEQLEPMLENQVPPVQLQTGGAAGRREILVASWLHSLTRFGADTASLNSALADLELQRFFAKALEMSFVLEHWRST